MRFFFSISFLFLFSIGFSQQTSRLRIESGSSVYFYFNSWDKIKNGITYNAWTKLSIYYDDPSVVGGNWELTAKANTNTIVSETGIPANNLNLATIELVASGNASNMYQPLFPLSAIDTRLALGPETAPATTSVQITYQCGVNDSYTLFGKKTDYYYVDIILTLRPKP